jgi:hypothetical protein
MILQQRSLAQSVRPFPGSGFSERINILHRALVCYNAISDRFLVESMIAPALLSALLCVILVYAWSEQRRAPLVAASTMIAAAAGLYLVWFPSHANALAEVAGVGRGADLILYLWVLISLLVLFNLHLKLRSQMELITQLSREIALLKATSGQAGTPSSDRDPGAVSSLENGL